MGMTSQAEAWCLVNELINRYALLVEANRFDDLGACFTDDVVLDLSDALGDRGRQVTGRDAAVAVIRETRESRGPEPRRHLLSNLVVLGGSGTRLETQALLTLVVTPPGGTPHVELTGRYEDVVVRSDGGPWRFERRHLHRDGA